MVNLFCTVSKASTLFCTRYSKCDLMEFYVAAAWLCDFSTQSTDRWRQACKTPSFTAPSTCVATFRERGSHTLRSFYTSMLLTFMNILLLHLTFQNVSHPLSRLNTICYCFIQSANWRKSCDILENISHYPLMFVSSANSLIKPFAFSTKSLIYMQKTEALNIGQCEPPMVTDLQSEKHTSTLTLLSMAKTTLDLIYQFTMDNMWLHLQG